MLATRRRPVSKEKPVRMREKLSKAKPRDIKGVCRGLPWVLFWPGNSLAGPSVRLGNPGAYVPNFRCHSTLSLTQCRMPSASGQRESATNRLGEHGGMGLGPMRQECKVLHDE